MSWRRLQAAGRKGSESRHIGVLSGGFSPACILKSFLIESREYIEIQNKFAVIEGCISLDQDVAGVATVSRDSEASGSVLRMFRHNDAGSVHRNSTRLSAMAAMPMTIP